MGNIGNASVYPGGVGVCGPSSIMCSGPSGCGECRTRCTTVDTLSTCNRTPHPQRYEYPVVGQASTPRTPLEGRNPAPDAAGKSHQAQQAQQLVKSFVRNIVKGINVTLLSGSSAPTQCVLSLDRRLSSMLMHHVGKAEATKSSIPLEQISAIIIGDDSVGDSDTPANEMCVTLFFENSRVFKLEFPDLEERDTFALCLSMFVDGRRGEIEPRTI